jgi:hypothetical protein
MKKISNKISLRIALPAFLTVILFVTTIFFIILPQLEQSFTSTMNISTDQGIPGD